MTNLTIRDEFFDHTATRQPFRLPKSPPRLYSNTAGMPIYCFHVDVDAPPQIVVERVQANVAKKKPFLDFVAWWTPDPMGRSFAGTVTDSSFRISRNISYRNSFLPVVCGRFTPTPTGTRVNVIMFIHPIVATFMLLWLGWWSLLPLGSGPILLLQWAMVVFGVALTGGCFFPEAIKAKRLISKVVQNATINAGQPETRRADCR